MNTAIFETIMFSPLLIAISLIILLFFILLYYFIKIINTLFIKFFHIDKKLMDKVHIISFVSINILISAYFLISLLYKINTYGTDFNTFMDKDNKVYLGNIIFTFSLILENIIISIICIFLNKFKLFRNGF